MFGFFIFGFLDFGVLDFWIFGFPHSGSLDLWISGRQDLYFRVPLVPGLDNATVHICTIYMCTHMCMNTHRWLSQAFAVAEGYLANRILVHCLVPVAIKMMMVKVRIMVRCLVAVLIATMIVNALVRVWIYYSVTTSRNNSNIQSTIATIVPIIRIRIRSVKLVRVLVTATVIRIVVIMTMIMIVIPIVLVAISYYSKE